MNEKHPSYDILAAKQADLPSLKRQDLLCFATTKREARNPKKFEGGKPNNNYRKIKYSWKHEKKRGESSTFCLYLFVLLAASKTNVTEKC